MLDTVHSTMDCVHFRCTITHLCSSLVPKECYPYLVSVRNEQRVSKKCRVREHALRAILTGCRLRCTFGILPWTHCVHFRCTIKHLCSSLVPKECYPYLVSVRNEQRVSKKCVSHRYHTLASRSHAFSGEEKASTVECLIT